MKFNDAQKAKLHGLRNAGHSVDNIWEGIKYGVPHGSFSSASSWPQLPTRGEVRNFFRNEEVATKDPRLSVVVDQGDNSPYSFHPNALFLKKASVKGRKRWHDALVSGLFAQARNFVRTLVLGRNSYCCLGVAEMVVEGKGHRVGLGQSFPKGSILRKLLGMHSTNDPMIATTVKSGRPASASILNDTHRMGFKDIAKLIYPEAYVKK